MKLVMDDMKLSFSKDDWLDLSIGSGDEGEVFHYDDYALKVYHPDSYKMRLSEDDCLKMKEIPTECVLLPRGLLYDTKHNFIGYYTDYIHSWVTCDLLSLRMRDFIDRLDKVYGDLYILADHSVSVCDFHLFNFIYSNDFYFIDPGSYQIEEDRSKSLILSGNQEELKNFVVEDIFSTLNYGMKYKKKRQLLKDHFEGIEFLPDILAEESHENESVKTYVKRITS